MACLHAQNLSAVHPWYAIRTGSHREKVVTTALEAKGYTSYLPSYQTRCRWSDRVVQTSLPLFPGYVFARFDVKERLPIITTPGVVGIIGFGNEPAPVDDAELEAIQIVLRSGLAAEPCPFLHEGQPVRIKHGSLTGVQGILLKKKSNWRFVVSLSILQRSVSVEVDHDWVAAL